MPNSKEPLTRSRSPETDHFYFGKRLIKQYLEYLPTSSIDLTALPITLVGRAQCPTGIPRQGRQEVLRELPTL